MKLHFTRLIICFFTLLVCTASAISLLAQHDNVWIFGGAGNNDTMGLKLDFNNSSPVFTPTRFVGAGEAAASVCDIRGQLLFYTEGDTVWNKNGLVMPNGAGLTGIPQPFPNFSPTASAIQGALIVPMPGNPDKYYIFSIIDVLTSAAMGTTGHLYYSVVDMGLNGGSGDIISGKKGIFVDSGFISECIVSVAGNDCNIWAVAAAISPQTGTTDLFKVYEITENGINRTPKISDVGNGSFDPLWGDVSTISFSPDRRKLVRSRRNSRDQNRLELYDFDPATGAISNRLNLDSGSGLMYHSTCFSPDNSKLYTATTSGKLYQYDITIPTIVAINSSKILLDSAIAVTGIKRGPDHKLYYFSTPASGNILSRINYPNSPGYSSQPGTFASISNRKRSSPLMFSNTIAIALPDSTYSTNTSTLCTNGSINIQPSDTNFSWYLWDNETSSPSREIITSGTYWVRYGNYCHYKVDSFLIKISELHYPVISVDTFTLRTTIAYFTYQWLLNGQIIPGATDSNYTVTENGDYSVIISNKEGCMDTSDIYPITNVDIASLTSVAKNIRIYPNPSQDNIHIEAPIKINIMLFSVEGRQIRTSWKGDNISLADVTNGIYILYIYDTNGRLLKIEKIIKAKQ